MTFTKIEKPSLQQVSAIILVYDFHYPWKLDHTDHNSTLLPAWVLTSDNCCWCFLYNKLWAKCDAILIIMNENPDAF